jgi:hypothetical protein
MFLRENLDDDKRFELHYEDPRKGKVTFQARSVPIKEAWCDLLRRLVRKWGCPPEVVGRMDKVAIKGKLVQAMFDVNITSITDHAEGETGKFTIHTKGQPTPKVMWFLNDQPITAIDPRFKASSDGLNFHLDVLKSTPDMTGKITAQLKNEFGSADHNGVLEVEGEIPGFLCGYMLMWCLIQKSSSSQSRVTK